MEWIEVNQVILRYRLRPGPGPTLVLLHEMGGSLESWDEVIALLPEDYRVLAYDQRGAGMSEKIAGDFTIDDAASDLAALLDALAVDGPALVAGVAVGAAVAIRFAALHPDRVSHLLAMAPACGIAPEMRVAALERAHQIAAEGMRGQASALFERAFPPALRTDGEKYRQYRGRWLSTDARSLGAIYRMLATMDLSGDLRKLSGRVAFIGGSFDSLRPPAEIERLGGLAPGVETVCLPSGHFMTVNSPRLIANLLRRYVGEQASAERICREFLDDASHRTGAAQHAA